MDLRAYYERLRETEAGIDGEHVVVVSLATPDGGKAGIRTEVSRADAARLVVESRARIANAVEGEEYRRQLREARAKAEQALAAERMNITVISEAELRQLRERARQRN